MTTVDHDRDTHPDLTVRAPREDDDSGAITIVDGAGAGLTTRGSRTFGLGLLADPTPNAAFGEALGRSRCARGSPPHGALVSRGSG